MKTTIKLALLGILFAPSAAPLRAASAPAKTNFDLTISFQLKSYLPGVNPPRILRTRDIINGLSQTPYTQSVPLFTATNGSGVTSNFLASVPAGWTVTATGSTNVSKTLPLFSQTAQLVFRQVVNGSTVASRGVFVLDGVRPRQTATDVSPWVIDTATATALEGSQAGAPTRSFDTFNVLQGSPALGLTGMTTKSTGSTGSGRAPVLNSLQADVGGLGYTIFGTTTITSVISGTITYSGGRLE